MESLVKQNFANFPFNINTNWKKKKIKTTKENIFCSCRCPYDSEMVRCTVCEEWFNLRCLEQSLAKEIQGDLSFSYTCKNCPSKN